MGVRWLAATLVLCALGCASQVGSVQPAPRSAGARPSGGPHPAPEPPEPAAQAAPGPLPLQAPGLTYHIRAGLERPPLVKGRLDVPLGRRWRYIVIHHSATDSGNEAEFDRYHRLHRGWRGVGYHFVIDNGHGGPDGQVEVTFRWEQQLTGAHAASRENEFNRWGIGICLVGNFDRGTPTARQMEALVGLVNYLQERCGIPTDRIYRHRDVPGANTHCPGLKFPWYQFLALLSH